MNKELSIKFTEILVILSCETGNSMRECIDIAIDALNAMKTSKNKKLDCHFRFETIKENK